MIKLAEIVVDDLPIPCIVLDVSATGAHLYLTTPSRMPATVVLRLPGGLVRTAHLRWQRGADLGFEFPDQAIPLGPDLL